MEILGEFWWVVPVGSFIGVIFATVLGYKGRPKSNESVHSSISGAAVIDSTLLHRILDVLTRLAIATEKVAESSEAIENQMVNNAKSEEIRSIIANELSAELNKIQKKEKK